MNNLPKSADCFTEERSQRRFSSVFRDALKKLRMGKNQMFIRHILNCVPLCEFTRYPTVITASIEKCFVFFTISGSCREIPGYLIRLQFFFCKYILQMQGNVINTVFKQFCHQFLCKPKVFVVKENPCFYFAILGFVNGDLIYISNAFVI